MSEAAKKAWETRRKQGWKPKKQVVGFFREDGKTKPVTKPKAELKRKKVVKKPKKFKGVSPEKRSNHIHWLIKGDYKERRSHPISIKHTDVYSQFGHDRETGKYSRWVKRQGLKKVDATADKYENILASAIEKRKKPRQEGKIRFEPANSRYPTGWGTETGRIRLRKIQPDGTHVFYNIVRIEAPANQVYFKNNRGIMDSAPIHASAVIPNTVKQYFEVSEHFTKPGAKDVLGGYATGKTWSITNEKGLMKVLESFRKKGFEQIPYKAKM